MIKKTTFLGVFCSALALFAQGQQRTTVIKSASGNPTIGIVQFSGDAATRSKLENVMERSGWFDVKTGSQALRADIKLEVQASPGGLIQTRTTAPGKVFATSRNDSAGSGAVYETVDDLLRELFKVKALCSQKIYFVTTGRNNLKEIYSCYLDGMGQERVTFNNVISTEPSWGHKNALVYTMARNNALNVVLADMANKRHRVISSAPGLNASAGLSHTGTHLALPMSAERQVDLYVIDLRSGSRSRLTKDRNVESSPCFSPNDSQICFVSDKLGVPQLYLTSVAPGQAAKRISTGNNECVSPDWSNVTNKLCFSMKSNSGQRVIAVIDMSDPSYSAKVVTRAAGYWEAPSWAPDGRNIVCTRSDANGHSRDLYLVDSWSGAFRAISKGANLSLPAWRPAY